MRITRVYVDQPLVAESTIRLDERAARHVQQVLRLRPGQSMTLFNGDGIDRHAEIVNSDRNGVDVRLLAPGQIEPPSALQVHLGIGISRGERMDFAIQKAVELGVSAITPLHSERTVVQLKGERARKRGVHWQGVIIAACEQSGRNKLPTLHPVDALASWLSTRDSGLLLHHRAAQALVEIDAPVGTINLLIGPEGGLADFECELAVSAGFTPVRLGPRILRTETAPLAAISAIQALWGDFRNRG